MLGVVMDNIIRLRTRIVLSMVWSRLGARLCAGPTQLFFLRERGGIINFGEVPGPGIGLGEVCTNLQARLHVRTVADR